MLHEEAMIVRLGISAWTARKYDNKVTRKVVQDFGTSQDSGRFNKSLVARESLQGITRATANARAFHQMNTLPWDDAGGRILPSANFLKYSQGMRALRDEYERVVKAFIREYPEFRDAAEKRLGKMYSATDYPAVNALRKKFQFTIDFDPIPHVDDFRVTLKEHDRVRISEELTQRIDRRVEAANRDCYVRLYEIVKRFVKTLSDPGKRFHRTMMARALELVELLPALNITQDAELELLRKEVHAKLASQSPDALRTLPEMRASVAKDAKAILARMAKKVTDV